jgi:hypothetical protein
MSVDVFVCVRVLCVHVPAFVRGLRGDSCITIFSDCWPVSGLLASVAYMSTHELIICTRLP